MFAVDAVTEALGLPKQRTGGHSVLDFVARIEEGLPLSALDRLAAQLAPGDARLKYRFVPKATYERRKVTGRLSPEEGARLARVARVWAAALELWENEEDARDFLSRRHMMLEDRRSLDVAIESEIGAELVLGIIGRAKYGTAA
jgi:putative toxin-antitoxin system antitoxin component (TIGR02293 family)